MRITDIVKFFGCSPQNKELDAYLTSIGIIERPEFEENPAEDISLKSEAMREIGVWLRIIWGR